MVSRHPVLLASLLALATALPGCVPTARPLPGTPVPARLPEARLPAHSQQITFDWRYQDVDIEARGEGVARVAPPDSVRLDLFLAGGFGGGTAFLIGDRVSAPGGDAVRRFLPPAPLLWAALGRLAVPPASDTTARAEGEVLRADIGRDPTWRVTFVGDRLAGLERIEGDRLLEQVTREPDGDVLYEHRRDRRTLTLTVKRAERVPDFDASIWRP